MVLSGPSDAIMRMAKLGEREGQGKRVRQCETMQKTQAALRLQVQVLMSQLRNCKRCADEVDVSSWSGC